MGRARWKRKRRLGALRCSGPPRATGVGESVQAPILPCLRARYNLLRRSVLLSRGGWCRPRRGARTHLGCFSFTVSRCGAPSISVTSVPLVPPSARSACPQGGRDIRSAAKPRTAVQRKAAKPPTAAQSLRATGAVEVDCASRWLRVFLDGNDLPRPVRGLIQRPEGGDTGAAGPQGACFVVAGLGIVHP